MCFQFTVTLNYALRSTLQSTCNVVFYYSISICDLISIGTGRSYPLYAAVVFMIVEVLGIRKRINETILSTLSWVYDKSLNDLS